MVGGGRGLAYTARGGEGGADAALVGVVDRRQVVEKRQPGGEGGEGEERERGG